MMFRRFVIHAFAFLSLSLLNSAVAYCLLNDNFNIGYGAWYGICVVGITVVRSGVMLEELWNELINRKPAVKITTMS